ncbi:MAG TPA: efflux RND transporter periplasmic adaptor subunit [Minicystis sp.]|nr:efflux RND transporter periplasmic adaptor subunit [Minicystis sp.]
MTVDEGSPKPAPPTKSKGRAVPIALALLVLAAVAVVLFVWLRDRRAVAAERTTRSRELARGPRVEVVTVRASPPTRDVELPGEARGFQQATLYAKLSGYLRSIHVDRGDRVKKGQALGIVESPETDQEVAAAISDAVAKRITAERVKLNAESGVASAQDLDNAEDAARIAEANLARSRALTSYEILRAPFDGVITARYVDPGALLPAATGSTQAAQPVVDVSTVDRLRVFVYLGQDAAPFVRAGDAATVWQDEKPKDRVEAKVTRTTSALDPRTRTLECEIDVDNRGAVILPGTFVHVALKLAVPPAAEVPNEALVERDGHDLVAVVRDGAVHFAPIDIGGTDGRVLRVLRGVDSGETVAIDVPVELREGERVRASPAADEPGRAPPDR